MMQLFLRSGDSLKVLNRLTFSLFNYKFLFYLSYSKKYYFIY